MFISSLIVKVAFLYVADRQTLQGCPYVPTLRVSLRLNPEVTGPKLTIAASELGKDGTIKPYLVYRIH